MGTGRGVPAGGRTRRAAGWLVLAAALAAAPGARAQAPPRPAGPVLTLMSIEGSSDRQPLPLAVTGERVAGEWVPLSIASVPPGTKVTWALQSVFWVPAEIRLGESFTIGLCGAAAFGNVAGQPRRLGLEHVTEVTALAGGGDPRGAAMARSVQSLAFPDRAGSETDASQETEIFFRYSPSRSRPPDVFVYDPVKLKAEGVSGERSGASGAAQMFSTLRVVMETGLAHIEVVFREELVYGLSRYDLGQSFAKWWVLRYRPIGPGETAPRFGAPAHAPGTACPRVSTGVATVAAASAPLGAPAAGAAPPAVPPPAVATARAAVAAPAGPSSTAPAPATPMAPAPVPPPRMAAPAVVPGASGPRSDAAARLAVPDLEGRHSRDVEAELRIAGLTADFLPGSEPRSRDEEHRVERQEPAPGSPVALGSTVRVYVRSSYVDPRKAVPRLDGMHSRDVEAELRRAGLAADLVAGADPASVDEEHRVERQEPPPGALVAPGSAVRVYVRPVWVDPRRPVPDVTGTSQKEAEAELRRAGLAPAVQQGAAPRSREEEGRVERQDPAAGTRALPGSRVVTWVRPSLGDAPRSVPNVAGLDEAQAAAALQRAGLTPRLQWSVAIPPSAGEERKVHEQWPKPETMLEPWGTVDVWLYRGADAPDPRGAAPGGRIPGERTPDGRTPDGRTPDGRTR